ncbi:Transposase, Mutator family [Micrococcus luteus NCTC 2665]|uniref:Transposase, Mutator family n=1 Tax=Micrococcus luteus (strain ATCC 4698 / DSM 20030 / JCM 1464 / CCM 169 / CCUG 5858 / IAM 1056 / NBRC 3333 / NCIMB 9278 / NCTC 2665 / VKM Ac-2230) TaxID=465515 RepID=A0A7Z7P8W5_MICLC|nr:Transposase, Mutator family [Micrococcus luteus NCTC 2665]
MRRAGLSRRMEVPTPPTAVCPKSQWPAVKALLHSVYTQPDVEAVIAQYEHMIDSLATHLPAAAEHLEGARDEVLTFTKFP